MPYNVTYMWNLKSRINKQAEQKQIPQTFDWLPDGSGAGGMGKIGEGIKIK